VTNEENVAALCALIEEWERSNRSQLENSLLARSLAELRTPGPIEAAGQVSAVPSMARFLAARGVLAPIRTLESIARGE
jgi:hypothetical protein